jgi:hypothetical protein
MPEEIKITEPITAETPAKTTTEKPATFFGIKLPRAKLVKDNQKTADYLSKTVNYIYPFTIFIIILGIGWFLFFLYNNVYQTMTKAEIVSRLKASVSEIPLEKQTFDNILNKLQQKASLDKWQAPKNISSPFEYGDRTNLPAETITPLASTTSNSSTISTSTKTKK